MLQIFVRRKFPMRKKTAFSFFKRVVISLEWTVASALTTIKRHPSKPDVWRALLSEGSVASALSGQVAGALTLHTVQSSEPVV